MDYIQNSGLFQVVTLDKRPIGLGKTLARLIPKIRTEYMFYLQDDWEFEREVNLNDVVGVMENYPDINQIIFNKYRTRGVIQGFHYKEREVHPFGSNKKLTICLNNGWQLLPGVWRTKWIKKRCKWYEERFEKPEGYFSNRLGNLRERIDPDFCETRIGSYFWGPIQEYRYVYHLGNELRMQNWRLEGGKPGGSAPPREFDEKNKHPDVPWPIQPSGEGY